MVKLTGAKVLINGYGAVAQLGEHLVCNQRVEGSNPFSSTELNPINFGFIEFFDNLERKDWLVSSSETRAQAMGL